MTTFGLVHGAWHSACWDPTVAVLRARGHDAITMDLPCSDATAGVEGGHSPMLARPEALADALTSGLA